MKFTLPQAKLDNARRRRKQREGFQSQTFCSRDAPCWQQYLDQDRLEQLNEI